VVENLFAFWSGEISYIELVCLSSMVKAGHQIDVYTYDQSLKFPNGVTIRSASEIIDRNLFNNYKNCETLALFSDIFRYVGLQKAAGIWIDFEVMLLRPLIRLGDNIYAWQDGGTINNAILKLPADSIVLKRLIDMVSSRVVIGPYWQRRKKINQAMRGLLGHAVPIAKLEWGIIGPNSLTYYLREAGMEKMALPAPAFYPIHFTKAQDFFDCDAFEIKSRLGAGNLAIHFWNAMIKHRKTSPPPRG
jgi:hypothetical protein